MTRALNEFLFKSCGFADRRHKTVQFDRAIALDGLRPDFKESVHCRFFVNVFEDNFLALAQAGKLPYDPTAHSLLAPFRKKFRLGPETPGALRSLAQAYKNSPPPRSASTGADPRVEVAAQLEKLAHLLEQFIQQSPAASGP